MFLQFLDTGAVGATIHGAVFLYRQQTTPVGAS